MKRFLALLLCLALCLTLVPAAFAEDIEIVDTEIDVGFETEQEIVIEDFDGELIDIDESAEEPAEEEIMAEPASGECGDGLTWALDAAGKLTISGEGAMWNYSGSNHPGWYDQADAIRSVVVEEGVTRIGSYAFCDLRKMSSVSLPDGLLSIGARAFRSCNSLLSIKIPNSVERIEPYAFVRCDCLKSVTLPQGLTKLENSVFSGCISLTRVQLPESLTSIGTCAFQKTDLNSIVIPDAVTSIGSSAFTECEGLTAVTLGSSLTEISGTAFWSCYNLKEITIPAGVTSIGKEAFAFCSAIEHIKFLGCPAISDNCFQNVTAVAFYPDDGRWTDEMLRDYGPGTISWVPLSATLKLDKSSVSVAVKKTAQLTAKFSTGVPVDFATWSSSNETIATVDENGVVTARKYGKCVITGRIPALNVQASCEVQTLFWDVADPGRYYFKHVYWAAEEGITKGYDYEYFAPQEECTREQMMMFLWRLADQPEPTTTSSKFPDVKKGSYYYKAVLWASENKIANGYADGTYGVGLPCTREQAMTFLWRMAGKPEPKTTVNPFSDVWELGYYYKAVLWASENGIAKGYEDGTYGVGLACLREHMVTFLSRYAEKFN